MTTVNRPAPALPSHADFLLAQIRSGLAHLHASSDLGDKTFHQVELLLTKGTSEESATHAKAQEQSNESEEERLGRNNAWLRKTLLETDLLCNTVELAMNIAVPSALLGDTQRDAILKLVQLSQERIANAVTDPTLQNRTKSGARIGARGAQVGLRKGWNLAGQSVNDINRRREEARMKAESKKSDKQDRKIIKEELKREREDIIRKRQMAMLGGYEAGSRGATESDTSQDAAADRGGATMVKAVDSPLDSTPTSSSIDPITLSRNQSVTSAETSPLMRGVDGEAMVSVSCTQLTPHGSVAATTTFSPWSGLLLSSTIVATVDQEEEEEPPREAGGVGLLEQEELNIPESRPLPPPPSRRAPIKSKGVTEELNTFISPTTQGVVVDVTDGKQKTWSKRLGL
ncbi:hypothetical protein CBS101457_001509 [Exobasidium rhododendri]|nr:hypothetical protein CBS101457_001509 [Exobasidium rhododendri]